MKTRIFSLCFILCLLFTTNNKAQVLVKDITPGMGGTNSFQKMGKGTYRSENHIEFKGKLIFTASTTAGTPSILNEPFVTDGTPQGTHLLKNINPNFSSDARNFTECNGAVYFQANDGTHGNELWKTDGTETGTVLVKDIKTGAAGSFPTNMLVYKNHLYFLTVGQVFAELWRTDGTSAGTIKVKDIGTSLSYSQREMAVFHDTLFLISSSKRNVYKSGDGLNFTPCYTPTGNNIESVNELIIWDSTLVFTGTHTAGQFFVGNEIYKYDTARGIELLCNVDGATNSSTPTLLTPIADKLYFTAIGSLGQEVYVIDDDSTNIATLIKDINPGSGHSAPSALFPLGNKLLFTAEVGTGTNVVREVYSTDGTNAGTIQLTTSNLTNGGASPSVFSTFINVGNIAYFVTTPSLQKPTVYVTDGTLSGTKAVNNVQKNGIIVRPGYEMMSYNNKLHFFGDNGRIGSELFVLENRWMYNQDSVMDAHCTVWLKADTNLMYSHTADNTITTIINDVNNYETLHGTSGNSGRTDPSIIHHAKNGQSVIQFNADGKDGYLQTLSNQTIVAGQSATIITVAAKSANANNRNTILGLRPVPGSSHNILLAETNKFGNNSLSLGIHDGNAYCTSVGNTNWNANNQYSIITASVDKNVVYTKLNGRIEDSINNACNIIDGIKALTIGGSSFDYEPFEGNIGEMFVFDTVLSRQQRNMLEMYLALKFKVGTDTVLTPNIGDNKGIYVLDNSGIAVYFVNNNDADNIGSLTASAIPGNPGSGAGFVGSATSHDGTTIYPTSIGTNSYWRIINSGITNFEYDVMIDLNRNGIDSLDKRVILKRDNPTSKWQPLNTKRFGQYLYAYGLTSFSEFAVSSNLPDTVIPPSNGITLNTYSEHIVSVYPNPANDYIILHFDQINNNKLTISIQNIQGVTLQNSEIEPRNQANVKLDLTGIIPGVYILQITDNTTSRKHSAKILKQ